MKQKLATVVRFRGACYVLADRSKITPPDREKLNRYLKFKKKTEEEAVADLKTVSDSLETANKYLSRSLSKQLKDIPDIPTLDGRRINPTTQLNRIINSINENKKQLEELRGSLYALVNHDMIVDDEAKEEFSKALYWILNS